MAKNRAGKKDAWLEPGAWLDPSEVLSIAKASKGNLAAEIIMDQLQGGVLIAIASRWSEQSGTDSPVVTEEPTPIAATLWPNLEDEALFWSSGGARFYVYDPIWPRTVRCYEIRFRAKTIKRIFPVQKPTVANALVVDSTSATPSQRGFSAAKPSNAGRHRKPFWDDLLIAMFEQLWDGAQPAPTCAADIERAMLDWVENNGHELGPTSVKAPAKKLFAAYIKGVRN